MMDEGDERDRVGSPLSGDTHHNSSAGGSFLYLDTPPWPRTSCNQELEKNNLNGADRASEINSPSLR